VTPSLSSASPEALQVHFCILFWHCLPSRITEQCKPSQKCTACKMPKHRPADYCHSFVVDASGVAQLIQQLFTAHSLHCSLCNFGVLVLTLHLHSAGSNASLSNKPAAATSSTTVNNRQGSGMGMQWKNQTATKGLIAPITLGASSQGSTLGASGQRPGSLPINSTSSSQSQQPVQHQHSLI